MNREFPRKIAAAILGVLFVGCGIAINNGAGLGNDPVGIFYDGIRLTLNLNYEQLNIASSVVNFLLLIIVFFTGRKYVNLGTLIYIVPYAICISIGTSIFNIIPCTDFLVVKILCSIVGCCLLYSGVALFVVADIGLDPFTGLSMVIAKTIHKDFKFGKWITDSILISTGFILGGSLGIITIITLIMGGPMIQFFEKQIKRISLT